MSTNKKPKITEEKIGSNPFLETLVVPVNEVKSDNRFKNENDVWLLANYEFDGDDYTKVFNKSDHRLVMMSLSARAKELYLFLIYELDKGKDYVWINKKRYMEESGVTAMNTYRAALNELIVKKYLLKTVIQDVMWTNPKFFFNGNRIKSFPNNLKRRKTNNGTD